MSTSVKSNAFMAEKVASMSQSNWFWRLMWVTGSSLPQTCPPISSLVAEAWRLLGGERLKARCYFSHFCTFKPSLHSSTGDLQITKTLNPIKKNEKQENITTNNKIPKISSINEECRRNGGYVGSKLLG